MLEGLKKYTPLRGCKLSKTVGTASHYMHPDQFLEIIEKIPVFCHEHSP
jgi:hypothetical protein